MASIRLTCISGLLAIASLAQQPPPPGPPATAGGANPFGMDLDSLSNTTVTTASKFTEKLSDASAVVSVVTQDELQRFGGTTLLEVLERVSGLNITTSVFGDSSMVAVRGDQARANSGHILLLINGRPVREVMEGGVSSDILESFPINILERIEIVKGPGSVLYGSGAFSGVINLITKKAEGSDFRLSAAGGAEGEGSGTEQILFQRGAFNLVEGGESHVWPRWDITERSLSADGGATAQNAALRDEGTGAYLGINYKGLSFMSSYTAQEAPSFVIGIVGDTRLKRGFSDVGYSVQAAEKWAMTFNFTYSRSVMDAPDFPTIHRDSYEGDLEWTNFITFSENDRLTFGTVYNHIAGLERYFGVTPGLVIAQGGRNAGETYVQLEHKLTDDLKLIGGVQASKIGEIGINAVPRGGLLWDLSNHITMKLLYGGAYNAPSLEETLLHHPALIGNPNLIPEKVGTLDAQLIYQSNRMQLSVDYFHSRQTDLIIQNNIPYPAVYYNNPAPVHFQGAEAEGKLYLKRDWFLIGSFLYQENDSGPGLANVSSSPAVVFKAGAGFRSATGTDLSAFDAYQSQIAGYEAVPNPPAVAFHTISARARYDLSRRWLKSDSRGFALFLNGDDLLNKPVWLPGSGSATANTLPVTRGRTVLFGVEVWQKQKQ